MFSTDRILAVSEESVQYYTIQRFTPALTVRKECRGTLFPASVTREIGG